MSDVLTRHLPDYVQYGGSQLCGDQVRRGHVCDPDGIGIRLLRQRTDDVMLGHDSRWPLGAEDHGHSITLCDHGLGGCSQGALGIDEWDCTHQVSNRTEKITAMSGILVIRHCILLHLSSSICLTRLK
jgi:hypothetical protein